MTEVAARLPHRSGRVLAGCLVVLAVACGCASRHVIRPSGPDLGALDRAISALNQTRATALSDAGAVVAAAMDLDEGDALAAAGNAAGLAPVRDRTHGTVARATAAVARLPESTRAYADALDGLATAAQGAGLTSGQRQALVGVVVRGADERRALEAFLASVNGAWPAYLGLDTVEATWATRAGAGWYRSTQEAANAYAVLGGNARAALGAARPALAQADAARVSAGTAMTDALRTARAATSDLG